MSDTPETTIPADDVILRGYCGPCKVWTPDSGGTGALRGTGHWAGEIVGACYLHGQDVRLDCTLASVRDHIARLLSESGAPIEHLLDRPGSKLTAAQSAVFVADSYARWRRGLPIVHRVYLHVDNVRRDYIRDTEAESIAAALAANCAILNDDGSVTLPELPTETK